MSDDTTVVMRGPQDAHHATWAMGSLFEHLLLPEESGGRLAVATVTQPPGIATPLHRHTREAEAFFVLAGEMTYRAGEEDFELTPGCFMYLPQGIPHAFRVHGDVPVHYLALTEPGHLLGLYDEVGVPAGALRVPGEGEGRSMEEEIARWNGVGPRYGLEVVGPPIPEATRS
ncbi:hypothetical protein ASC64_12460 [Nocardioides sp. Root122]|uniref:cupin domain-containing protein n=1 Tax=Nocardioides TaxID=1839 RepID=UPI00070318A0|nr:MULTISPECIES: cupin domain-containing protein [Nocardioides]KQV65721.1 hypothetical protein ASC64_12460 [Nocardioides sp. Root122]MCK9825637.1 cupin domain-containing protein [Nocardioides cavernae]